MTSKSWTRTLMACAAALVLVHCAPGSSTVDTPDAATDATSDATSGRDVARTRDAHVDSDRDTSPLADASSDVDATDATDASTADATDAAQEDGLVPVFIAQGHVGRTTISCDDGETWVADRAFDTEGHDLVCERIQPVQCYDTACDFMNGGSCDNRDPCDCDHHPGAGRGVTWGDGWFVTTWGWGPAGGLMRSRDGIEWEMVHTGTTFAGVVYGNERFVTGGRSPLTSQDLGATWTNLGEADLRSPSGQTVYNPRSLGFAEGVFVLTGSSGDESDMLVSPDGQTWSRPDPLPAPCTTGIQGAGAVGGGGVIVLVNRSGGACASSDQGASFQHVADAGTFDTGVVHDGEAFLAWGDGARWRSTDGVTWDATPLTANVRLGHVAHHPDTGTLVASNGGWKQWYEKQRFFRSTDGGITWDELAEGTFNGSHPIQSIGFGWAPASATCPSPAEP